MVTRFSNCNATNGTSLVMTDNDATTSSGISTVTLKLPPFWPADPVLWFVQVESQFATRRITADMSKYHHVVSSLSPAIATEVRDLLISPPAEDAYNTLKAQLIRRTSASEEKRLRQLLTAEELGDRTPTQLLRRLEQLLGEKATTIDQSLLRELFLQRLPSNVRMVLASAGDIGLAKIADLADKIIEVSAAPTTISAVQGRSTPDELGELRAEVRRLADMMAKLQVPGRRSTSRERPRRRPRSSSRTNSGECWYHQRFGPAARKCEPPCSRAENGRAEH